MTLMKLRKKLASRRTTQTILWTLIAVFLVGIALWSVPSGGQKTNAPRRPGSSALFGGGPTLATINGTKFTAAMFEGEYSAQVTGLTEKQQPPPTYASGPQMRAKIFMDAVRKSIVDMTLRQEHLTVNYFTLRDVAREYAEQQVKTANKTAQEKYDEAKKSARTPEARAKLKTKAALLSDEYKGTITASGKADVTSMGVIDDKKFTNWFVNDFLLKKGENGLYERMNDHVRIRKIGVAFAKTLPVDPFSASYVKKVNTKDVKASWIFIAAQKNTEESLQAAEKLAKDTQAALVNNPSLFAAKARELSDDSQSKMVGGLLAMPDGWITGGSGQLAQMAEYLAYTTEPGKISPPTPAYMSTYFSNRAGYAIVKVDAVRDRKMPNPEWKKDPAQITLAMRQRLESDLGETRLFIERAKAKVVCTDDELALYQAEDGGDTDKANEIRQRLYAASLKDSKRLPPEVAAGLAYRLAMSETDLPKRAKLLEAAAGFAAPEEASNLLFDLGNIYARLSILAKTSKPTEAKSFYDKALATYENALLGAAETDTRLRKNILRDYQELGYAAGIAEMKAWLKAHENTASEAPMGNFDMSTMGQ